MATKMTDILLEQSQISVLEKIFEYINSLTHPDSEIRPTVIYRYLKEIELSKFCRIYLDTRSKSLGSWLSRKKFKSTETNANTYQIKLIENNLSNAIKYISGYRNSEQITNRATCQLGQLLDILSRILISLKNSSERSQTGYCPFCWRQPIPGKNTRYCYHHLPDTYKDHESGKIVYETDGYDKGKAILKRAQKYFKIIQTPYETSQDIQYSIWGQLKILYNSKHQMNSNAHEAWENILEIETNNRFTINTYKQSGISTLQESLWDISDWRKLAKLITIYVNGQPLLNNKENLEPPSKNEPLKSWQLKLANYFGEENILEFDIEPGEILGLVDRYQVYFFLLEITKPTHSSASKNNRNFRVIEMINNGKSISETAKFFKISRQRAHQIYIKKSSTHDS